MTADGDDQDNMLRHLCRALIASELRTDAYRASPMGTDPASTLQDYLADKLMAEFEQRFVDAGLIVTDKMLADLVTTRKAGRKSQLLVQLGDEATTLALYQLWADLTDEPGPRHRAAKLELRYHAQQHLERSRFRYSSSPTPAFHSVLIRAKELGMDAEDLHDEFWRRRIWPNIIRGRGALSHPLKLHGALKTKARSFITDRNDEIAAILASLGELPDVDDDGDLSNAMDNIAEPDAGVPYLKLANPWQSQVEATVIQRMEREEDLRLLLRCLDETPKRNNLGLLVLLLQKLLLPRPPADVGSGINQKIAALLEVWRIDRDGLDHYLRDWDDGLALPDALAAVILEMTADGFANAPNPITAEWVAVLSSRFLSDLRQVIQRASDEYHNPPPGHATSRPDRDHSATSPVANAAGSDANA